MCRLICRHEFIRLPDYQWEGNLDQCSVVDHAAEPYIHRATFFSQNGAAVLKQGSHLSHAYSPFMLSLTDLLRKVVQVQQL